MESMCQELMGSLPSGTWKFGYVFCNVWQILIRMCWHNIFSNTHYRINVCCSPECGKWWLHRFSQKEACVAGALSTCPNSGTLYPSKKPLNRNTHISKKSLLSERESRNKKPWIWTTSEEQVELFLHWYNLIAIWEPRFSLLSWFICFCRIHL